MKHLQIICFGASHVDDNYLISRGSRAASKGLRIDKASDGLTFEKVSEFKLPQSSKSKASMYQDFRLSKVGDSWILASRVIELGISKVRFFKSNNLSDWEKAGKISDVADSTIVINDYNFGNKYVAYVGGSSINITFSDDLKDWDKPVRILDINQASTRHHAIMGSTINTNEGILLIYFQSESASQVTQYAIKALLFDKDDPSLAIWSEPKTIMDPQGHKMPLGVGLAAGHIVTYWQTWDGAMEAIIHGSVDDLLDPNYYMRPHPRLRRYEENPVLGPNPKHDWQSEAVFNPAVIYDEGLIHLLYRAVGRDNISVWGHATSSDGVNFDTGEKPIYTPMMHFNRPFKAADKPSQYVSGPGWGGCEDPRAVVIDDKLYVIYVAFDGYNPQRIAVTSLDMDDFRAENWVWSAPALLSAANVSSKNWVLFPEKIDGRFAVLHSITPQVSVEFVDNLKNPKYIDSHFAQTDRYDHWDNWVRGSGPPPVKTEHGWLLFYHAMDVHDPGKYKLGAMLLDLKNPTKILHRSRSPVLEPSAHYEKDGIKPDVIFATGAIEKDNQLSIYYGSCDNTISVAHYQTSEFLENLINHNRVKSDIISYGAHD